MDGMRMIDRSDIERDFVLSEGSLIRKSNGRRGYLRPDGYVYTRINGDAIGEHRLVFLLVHGYLPDQVDHVNRVRNDNRPENLRAAKHGQNCMNRTPVSEMKGCYWQPKRKRWLVQIGFDGKRLTVGYAKTADQAKAMRDEAAKKYHREFAA